MNEVSNTAQKTLAISGILLLFIGLLIGISYLAPSQASELAEEETTIERVNAFEGVVTTAKAAVVYDIREGTVLFTKEAETQLPLASITKLLTAYVATRELGENAYVEITQEDLAIEGDSGLLLSETWKVGDLARFVLMSSSNDGAHALIRATSERKGETPAALLSQSANALSLVQTFAVNGTGLDANKNVSGGYGSAKDVALLLAAIYEKNRSLLIDSAKKEEIFHSMEGFRHFASSTNQLATYLPQLVGAKTGFTDLAGGNLAVLLEIAPNRPVAIVVLGSTIEGRFEDVERLTERTLQHFTYKTAL